MGIHRGKNGPASAALLTWLKTHKDNSTLIIIHENVVGFDSSTLLLMADRYDIVELQVLLFVHELFSWSYVVCVHTY